MARNKKPLNYGLWEEIKVAGDIEVNGKKTSNNGIQEEVNVVVRN